MGIEPTSPGWKPGASAEFATTACCGGAPARIRTGACGVGDRCSVPLSYKGVVRRCCVVWWREAELNRHSPRAPDLQSRRLAACPVPPWCSPRGPRDTAAVAVGGVAGTARGRPASAVRAGCARVRGRVVGCVRWSHRGCDGDTAPLRAGRACVSAAPLWSCQDTSAPFSGARQRRRESNPLTRGFGDRTARSRDHRFDGKITSGYEGKTKAAHSGVPEGGSLCVDLVRSRWGALAAQRRLRRPQKPGGPFDERDAAHDRGAILALPLSHLLPVHDHSSGRCVYSL